MLGASSHLGSHGRSVAQSREPYNLEVGRRQVHDAAVGEDPDRPDAEQLAAFRQGPTHSVDEQLEFFFSRLQRGSYLLAIDDLENVLKASGEIANSELRASLPEAAFAPLPLCTDNAAMIASAARYVETIASPEYLSLDAYAAA